MRTVEQIVEQIDKNNKKIEELTKKNAKLFKEFLSAQVDYVTISHACRKYDVSYRFLYNFVSTGEIKNYSKGTRILLKIDEVENVLLKKVE